MSIADYQFTKLTPAEQATLLSCQLRGAIGLITEEITASMLDVEVSTLATWRSQGKGPDYVKLGKTVFYTTNSIAAWVNTELAKQREARAA